MEEAIKLFKQSKKLFYQGVKLMIIFYMGETCENFKRIRESNINFIFVRSINRKQEIVEKYDHYVSLIGSQTENELRPMKIHDLAFENTLSYFNKFITD